MSLAQKDPAERRRYARAIPLAGRPVEVQLMGTGFLDVLCAEDVSERGLLVQVPHDFNGCDISHQVDLIVSIPHAAPFKARGVIRHAKRGHDRHLFGVELTEIHPRHQATIATYVERLVALGRKV